jgi:hypothetical protein
MSLGIFENDLFVSSALSAKRLGHHFLLLSFCLPRGMEFFNVFLGLLSAGFTRVVEGSLLVVLSRDRRGLTVLALLLQFPLVTD